MAAGIDTRHISVCRSRSGGRCNCEPSYRVQVWDPRARKLHRKTFRNPAEAKTWRDDVRVAVRKGEIRPSTKLTVSDAAAALIAGMADGTILTNGTPRKPYKPSTRRSYEHALRKYVMPDLGAWQLTELRRKDVQAFADRLRAKGLSPSSVHNKLDPLRVIYRRALRDDLISVDPTDGLELERPNGRRSRIAHRDEAERLIAALPENERALWATALYGGLRRGELRALRWSDIDLANEPALIHCQAHVGRQRGRSRRQDPSRVPINPADRPATGADRRARADDPTRG